MNRRRRRRELGAGLALCALAHTGCGDYDPEPQAAGGSSGQTSVGQLNPPEQASMGGTGQLSMGGAGPIAMGGNGPASGGGGASGSGAGGSAGGAAMGMGGSSPTVPMVDADCSNVTPCGGDVAGTWVAAGSCLPVSGTADMTGFGLGCQMAPITGMLEVTGTFIANADGTFLDQTTTSGESQLDLPSACLNVSGTTTTCDRLGGALQALGYSMVTCVDAASGGGCTCTATAQQTGGLAMVALGPPQSGTYATANNVMTTTATSASEYAYCVTGDTLVVTPQSPGKTGSLAGTIVLVKP